MVRKGMQEHSAGSGARESGRRAGDMRHDGLGDGRAYGERVGEHGRRLLKDTGEAGATGEETGEKLK